MPILERAELQQVVATRYVLPLREGGSLPALMEADDLGTYVVKFRGAGQGPKALVAEIVVAGLARAAGLLVPDLVLVAVDPLLGRAEPDQEVQDLLRTSAGLNLGVDYLPRALGYDPAADRIAPDLAARIVWFDAFVQNVDRSWRNPNLLRWHGETWLIDHGAALFFAHNWPTAAGAAGREYTHAGEHVLLPAAGPLRDVDEELADALRDDVLHAAVAPAPDEWLDGEEGFAGPDEVRAAYVAVLAERLAHREAWLAPLEDTRAAL